MTDDRKPPPLRLPATPPLKRSGTIIGDRNETNRKPVTPVSGVQVSPRQDDQPQDFASITGVDHPTLEAELVARAKRTQHVTEGIAANTLSFAGRLSVVEKDLGAVKVSVDSVKASLDAQDKYLKPLVDVLVSKETVEHTKTKATIEIDTVKQVDEVKEKDARRERWTLSYRNVSTFAAPLLAALAAWLLARSC